MAIGATIHTFAVQLADVDRGVYDDLTLRVARHPSETDAYMLTRVLAYCLEFEEGIAFSTGGLSDPDEPALSVRDLTGALRSWIEIGAPDAARPHRPRPQLWMAARYRLGLTRSRACRNLIRRPDRAGRTPSWPARR